MTFSHDIGSTNLQAGFQDPVLEATDCFRNVMEAMARPTQIQPLSIDQAAPEGLHSGSAQVLLTLLDFDSRLYLCPELDLPKIRDWVRFHTGCPITQDPANADFAVMTAGTDPEITNFFPIGTPEYPDRSTTVLMQVDQLLPDQGPSCTGPGMAQPGQFTFTGATDAHWRQIVKSQTSYPCGLDWIFLAPDQLAALPRSTRLEVPTCM